MSGALSARLRAAAHRMRTGLALLGLIPLSASLAAGCETQEVHLFEPVAGAAGENAGTGSDSGAGGTQSSGPFLGVQPECETAACQSCVQDTARCLVGGARWLCHPQSGRCAPPCDPESNPTQCSADQRCHPEHGLCVDCVDATSCSGANRACDPASGRCVACTVDEDCGGATPACDTLNQRCVACTEARHCPAGFCAEGRNVCVVCRNDGDCGGETLLCTPDGQRCVECLTSADCTRDPEKPVCKPIELECDDDAT